MSGSYQGPMHLLASKYALPHKRYPLASQPDTTIVTMEQIAASDSAQPIAVPSKPYNGGAELALMQGAVWKKEVDKHTAYVGKSVSSTISNIRQLLNLIRTSISKDNQASPADIKTVDRLWSELEHLFRIARESKDVLPKFMDKQKENMSLFHTSMVDEALNNSLEEPSIEHKEVTVQASLILEQQQSFLEYKLNTESKLQELGELQERVSRLTLDKGLLKSEIDNYAKQLESSNSSSDEGIKLAESLRTELAKLKVSEDETIMENETLRRAISDLQGGLKAAEQKIADHYKHEIRGITEQLGKEFQKCTALESLIRTLRSNDSSVKAEVEQMKELLRAQSEKFKNQASEFAALNKAKADLLNQTANLNNEISALRIQNASLNDKLKKMEDLKADHASLSHSSETLKNEIKDKQIKLNQADQDHSRAKVEMERLEVKVKKAEDECESLKKQLKKAKAENEYLEIEVNELVGKQSEQKKITAAWSAVKGENGNVKEEAAKLRATVQDLEKKPAPQSSVGEVAGTSIMKEKAQLEEKLKSAEKDKATLEAEKEIIVNASKSWEELARRSYQEYKDILPVYHEVENYRNAYESKDREIAQLKIRSAQANSVLAAEQESVKYWKNKYDALLAQF